MEDLGALSGIVFIFLVIAAILAVFIPFFIFSIRNNVISINKKMDKLIELQGGNPEQTPQGSIRYCTNCGGKNRFLDTTCMHCGKPI